MQKDIVSREFKGTVISDYLTVSYLDMGGSLLGTAMSLYEVRVKEGESASI